MPRESGFRRQCVIAHLHNAVLFTYWCFSKLVQTVCFVHTMWFFSELVHACCCPVHLLTLGKMDVNTLMKHWYNRRCHRKRNNRRYWLHPIIVGQRFSLGSFRTLDDGSKFLIVFECRYLLLKLRVYALCCLRRRIQ